MLKTKDMPRQGERERERDDAILKPKGGDEKTEKHAEKIEGCGFVVVAHEKENPRVCIHPLHIASICLVAVCIQHPVQARWFHHR